MHDRGIRHGYVAGRFPSRPKLHELLSLIAAGQVLRAAPVVLTVEPAVRGRAALNDRYRRKDDAIETDEESLTQLFSAECFISVRL